MVTPRICGCGSITSIVKNIARQLSERNKVVIFSTDATKVDSYFQRNSFSVAGKRKIINNVDLEIFPIMFVGFLARILTLLCLFWGLRSAPHALRKILNLKHLFGIFVSSTYLSPDLLFKLLKVEDNFDVIISFTFPHITNLYSNIASTLNFSKLIIIPFFHIYDASFRFPYLLNILRSADKVIATTLAEKNIMTNLGVNHDRIIVGIPLGLKKNEIKGSADLFRKKYSIGTERVILFVGRQQGVRGLFFLIEAVKKIVANLAVKLVIIGEPIEKTPSLPFIVNLGRVHSSIRDSAYRAADVVAIPSPREALGFVYLEAMACGKAIIMCDTPVSRELFGNSALYVKFGDIQGLSDVLQEILHNNSLRTELGKLSKSKLFTNFSPEKTLQFESIINSMIKIDGPLSKRFH